MTKRHFEVLKQIRDSGSMVKIEYLRSKYLDADSIISDLLESGCIEMYEHIPDENYAGDYKITGKGLSLIIEYIEGRKTSTKMFLIKDVAIPIVVAAITAYFTVLFNVCLSLSFPHQIFPSIL